MRKTIVLAILFAIGIVVFRDAAPARAQSVTNGSISTTGDAEILVVPDQVVITLGVETWDKDMSKAKAANDDRINRVLALTKNYGIDPKSVQTDWISVDPRYRNGTYDAADFIGYFVRKTVVITLKDISKFEDVYTGALAAGVTHVQGVEFRTTELRKYRDQARALAIQAAQEKAVALAAVLGRKVGKAQSIQEQYSGWSSWYGSRWNNNYMTQNVVQNSGGSGTAFSDDSTFAPGQISVQARVSVTFSLE